MAAYGNAKPLPIVMERGFLWWLRQCAPRDFSFAGPSYERNREGAVVCAIIGRHCDKRMSWCVCQGNFQG